MIIAISNFVGFLCTIKEVNFVTNAKVDSASNRYTILKHVFLLRKPIEKSSIEANLVIFWLPKIS